MEMEVPGAFILRVKSITSDMQSILMTNTRGNGCSDEWYSLGEAEYAMGHRACANIPDANMTPIRQDVGAARVSRTPSMILRFSTKQHDSTIEVEVSVGMGQQSLTFLRDEQN